MGWGVVEGCWGLSRLGWDIDNLFDESSYYVQGLSAFNPPAHYWYILI